MACVLVLFEYYIYANFVESQSRVQVQEWERKKKLWWGYDVILCWWTLSETKILTLL